MQKSGRRKGQPLENTQFFVVSNQRLENWKLRRALARPSFLRSTTRKVARQEAATLEDTAQIGLVTHQRLRQAVTNRAGLARQSTA